MNIEKANENENVFSKLKNIYTAYSIGIIYIILIILTLFILFNSTLFKSNKGDKNSIGLTVFAIISFVLISLALCIILLPNLKNIDILLKQIKNTFYLSTVYFVSL